MATLDSRFKAIGENLGKLGASVTSAVKENLARAGEGLGNAATALNDNALAILDNKDAAVLKELWEPSENCSVCRDCQLQFIAPVRTKHHCRGCGSVYCQSCLSDIEINASSVSREVARKLDVKEPSTVKLCKGCIRGDSPGEEICGQVLGLLQAAARKSKSKGGSSLAEARARALNKTSSAGGGSSSYHDTASVAKRTTEANSKEKTALARLGTTLGDTLGILAPTDDQPSTHIQLSRGIAYGGGRGDGSEPPLAGYFELTNKSRKVVAVKLLVKGGNPLFEAARPSYTAIAPGESVNGHFSSAQEGLELIVLTGNPHAIGSPLSVDTRKPNAHVDRISDAAKIPQFKEFNMFRMTCTKANCLLKVKEGGIVEARVGDSVGRIGVFAKLQGKRWRKGELDYNTNISAVHPIKKEL
jgi:hypothetical protein